MSLQFKQTVVKNFSFSDEIIQLYDEANVQNANEAIAILFHALLLESGFCPKDVPCADIHKLMPKDWNANGILKIKYSHNCCSSYTCSVTCIPLGNNVSIHGIICDTVCSESVNLKMNLSRYLKQKNDLSNIYEVFSNMDELSRHFKDHFCLPLLNLLHKTVGVGRLFGFPGLYDDLKILILMLLPVESIVSVSSVNKNLHFLGNSPFLWKYLFKRDYAKDGVPDVETSSKTDWKEMYKKEYVKRNRKPERRLYAFPYHHLPHLYQDFRCPRFFGPDWNFDPDTDLDPPFSVPSYIPPFYNPPLPPFNHPRLSHFFRK